MTALDGYGDFDTKRLSSKPVNTILDKTDVFYIFAFRGKWAPNLVLMPLNSVPGLGRATTRKWAIWMTHFCKWLVTREWKAAETWFLTRLFIDQSSIVSKILDFIHWMITIFSFAHMTGENQE